MREAAGVRVPDMTRRSRGRRPQRCAGLHPREAREIYDMARVWQPFGGPPAGDIFLRFGIARKVFEQRLTAVLEDMKKHGPPWESTTTCKTEEK